MSGWKSRIVKDRGFFILLLIFLIATPVLLTPWIHGHDGLGHYMILRSAVIDHDLDFSDEISRYQAVFSDLEFPVSELTGRPYTHYGIGNAILWAPFFLFAHMVVYVSGFFGGSFAADGFSLPYLYAVCFGSAFYGFCGVVMMYSMIKKRFGMDAALGSALLIWFATPLVYYMYFSSTVSHANSFFAVTLFLWYWQRTRKKRSLAQWAVLGLMSGLVFLVRQEDSLIFIIPAIESLCIYAKSLRKKRFDSVLFKKNVAYLLSLAVMMCAQFLFFKRVYGLFFVTGKQLAQHYFSLENILFFYKILISVDHGLFVWIPVSLVGLIGLMMMYEKDELASGAFIIAICLFVAFTASVKQWMAIGSFSARHFTGILGIFGIGLGCVWHELEKKVSVVWLWCLAAVFISWNLNLVIQYGAGLIGLQDPLYLPNVLYNTLYILPQKMAGILQKFIFSRGEFIRL